MDVFSTDVVTGICVALTDYLKIKQLQLEDQGPLKVDLLSVIIDEHKFCISHFNVSFRKILLTSMEGEHVHSVLAIHYSVKTIF